MNHSLAGYDRRRRYSWHSLGVWLHTFPRFWMVSLADFAFGLRCVLLGVKDSICGIWPVFQLVKQ